MNLTELGKEFLNRGERVSVEFGGHSFSGAVVAAGADYVVLDGAGQIGEIRLDTARWSVLAPGLKSELRPPSAESFVAMLHQHSQMETVLRFMLENADIVIGRVAVVGEDHIEVADVDGRKIYVPFFMILGTVRSTDH